MQFNKPTFPKIFYQPAVLLGIIILVGAILRFSGLYRPGSLSFDEAWSVWVAKKDIFALLQTVAHDKHPPLFYLIYYAWIRLAGDSELALRILPAIAGTAAPLCLYYLGKTLFDRTTGLFAALLAAVVPLQVFYSQEARMYPISQIFLLMSLLFFWKGRTDNRRKDWIIFTVSTTLMVYTHYVPAIILSAQGVFLIYEAWRDRKYLSVFRNWTICVLIAALPGLFWLPSLFQQVYLEGGAPTWISIMIGQPSGKDLILLFLRDFLIPFPEYVRAQRLLIYLAASLLLFSTFFIVQRKSPFLRVRLHKPIFFCALCLILPISIVWIYSQFEPMFVIRYFLPYSGIIYLLFAYGAQKFPVRVFGFGLFILVVVFTLQGSARIARVQREANWKDTARYMEANWQKGDVVLIFPPSNWIIFDYYTQTRIPRDAQIYKSIYPNYPKNPEEKDLTNALIDQPIDYLRLWLINEMDTGLSAEWRLDQESLPVFMEEHFDQVTVPESLNWKNYHVSLFLLQAKK